MAFRFTDPAVSPYRPGAFFLGLDPATGQEIGIKSERHALCACGARSGKGAALIVPNLKRWPHNCIVIDVKGENAEVTWQDRAALGQKVAVLDPFKESNVPDEIRASFNPLDTVDINSLSAREDINVIADGIVLRHDPRHAQWDDGAVGFIAGVIGHVLTHAPDGRRNLLEVRRLLNLPRDAMMKRGGEEVRTSPLRTLFEDMAENPAFGGLVQTAGNNGLSALENPDALESGALGNALESLKTFGADAIAPVTASSSFDLADLKTGNLSVFLVLPSRYMYDHRRFFRLFVRLALNEMEKPIKAAAGQDRMKGKECLFLLDEFYNLGRLDIVQNAAGRLPGNGVHLFPILQDIGQLYELYGTNGAHTFFGNSDAHIFFGNTDKPTLGYISDEIGPLQPDEIPPPPEVPQGMRLNEHIAREHEQAMNQYRHALNDVGKPRVPPDKVRELVAKHDGDVVARSMVVFGKGGHKFLLLLAPYFLKYATPQQAHSQTPVTSRKENGPPVSDVVQRHMPQTPPPPVVQEGFSLGQWVAYGFWWAMFLGWSWLCIWGYSATKETGLVVLIFWLVIWSIGGLFPAIVLLRVHWPIITGQRA